MFSVVIADTGDAVSTGRSRAPVQPHAPSRMLVVSSDFDMNDVQVGLEQTLDDPLPRVDSDRHAPEDACDDDTISGLDDVHQFVIHAQTDRMRRLAVWHRVGRFL